MAKDDWGIVVGITTYPDLGNLDGPENDANAFYDWLVDSAGGDVPKGNVTKILSSGFKPPYELGHEPTVLRVQRALEGLQDIGKKNVEAKRLKRVGRRLYLYLAGHGFSASVEQTALLMANASILRCGATYHVLGQYSARWFYNGGYFDEILLFMDCCRESATAKSLNMGFGDETDIDATSKGKLFYGFATKWGKNVREQEIDGSVRGIFTTTLLAGLRSGAVDPEREGGIITAQSLQAYLYNNLRKLIPPELQDDPDIPDEPEVTFEPPAIKDRPDFVIARASGKPQGIVGHTLAVFASTPPKFTTTFDVSPGLRGKPIVVRTGVGLEQVHVAEAAPVAWTVLLEPGTYVVNCVDIERIFEVSGAEENIHVVV